MGMFKAKISIGGVGLLVQNKEQWDLLVSSFKNLTVDETLESIYIEQSELFAESVGA